MTNPNAVLISVVIPVYNGEKFIADAINCVLKQNIKACEIIVINDCSSDNTIDALLPFSEYIHLINNKKNSGASYSRNQGIKAAQGKYIAFLDADDLWVDNKLERQLSLFKQHPNIGLSYGHAHIVPFEKAEALALDSFDNDKINVSTKSLIDIFSYPYFSTSTIVVLKQLCIDVGLFREDLKTAEDIDFCLKIAAKTEIISIEQTLSITRRLENSLGTCMQSYQDNLNVIDDFIQHHPAILRENKALVTSVKKRIYDDWICDLLYSRDTQQAFKISIKAIKLKITLKTIALLLKSLILIAVNRKRKSSHD